MLAEPVTAQPLLAADADGRLVRLSAAAPGDRGVIVDVRAESRPGDHGVGVEELQRRLLEFGFVEGAHLEVLHEGLIRRDPIAVRLDDMRVALRRRDADDVWVLLESK
ncbi:MAG TPA: FeoA family protein [Phenylobacterium sp.]|nr:FeoA family protein [Phenylobacterium sp.]HVI32604.1 FeoA family protein [Phenylobacterium sp.]